MMQVRISQPSSAVKRARRPAEDYRVQVLSRTFGILDELARERRELGSTDISERIGLHKSTVHRLLAVLESNRFVERNPATAKYRLGWRLFELGSVVISGIDLYERAKPEVSKLVDQTEETGHVGVLRQGMIVSLVNVESRRSLRTPSTVGRQTPFHCTSQGKAILAFLPKHKLEELLAGHQFKTYTQNTISSAARFRAELALTRKRGYAIDNEEFEEGLYCIGAPIYDHSGEVVAAISIAGPGFRIKGDRQPQLRSAVQQAAARLSLLLGHRSAPAPKDRAAR